jgi:hypothetical protein
VPETIKRLAVLRQVEYADLSRITVANAATLFRVALAPPD